VDIRKKDEVPHGIGSTGPAQDVLESKNDSPGFLRYHRVPKGANYPTSSRFSLSYVLLPSLALACLLFGCYSLHPDRMQPCGPFSLKEKRTEVPGRLTCVQLISVSSSSFPKYST
jgi:hypothetical protein